MNSPVSSARVDRAGRVLRNWNTEDPDSREAAMQVLLSFRSEHVAPLAAATMGLRSAVSLRGFDVKVSQRLKRVPTILDKLARLPHLKLSRLQDVGGCRAVLPDVEALREVQAHLMDPKSARTRQVQRVTDYITEPRESGYRAVHIIVAYQGRSIEVQLRTQAMHLWALHVERLTQKYGRDLKEPDDPTVRAYLSAIAEAMRVEEAGEVLDEGSIRQIDALRVASLESLRGSS